MKVAFCILSFLESILLQMEPGGVVGQLLDQPDPGWRFLRGCLMLLDPKDLKACRQVCKSLNEFIKSEVWGTEGGKKLVTQKLVNRWMTADARPDDLAPCLFFTIINGWHEEEFGSHFVKNFSGRQHPFR